MNLNGCARISIKLAYQIIELMDKVDDINAEATAVKMDDACIKDLKTTCRIFDFRTLCNNLFVVSPDRNQTTILDIKEQQYVVDI